MPRFLKQCRNNAVDFSDEGPKGIEIFPVTGAWLVFVGDESGCVHGVGAALV